METQAQLLTVEKAVIRSQFFRFQLLAAAGLSFASLLGCGEKVLKGTSEKMVKPTLDTNKNDLFYSFGKVKGKFPDGKDICAVPTLNDAHIKLAAIPAHQVRDPDKDDGDDTNGIELIDVEA